MNDAPMLELRDITRRFEKKLDFAGRIAQRLGAPVREEIVHAVDRVNLTVRKGEVVGLVGESGCGKSTLGRMVAGILPPTEGTILRDGSDIKALTGAEARQMKLRTQMIFQDPYASLNPRMRVQDIVGEAPRVHGLLDGAAFDDYVDEQMRRAGLDPGFKRRYPHQFSGGQRQRIGIARALAVKPDFIVCDEAVAALDVSIQAQILNLFMRLRKELDLTYLFISHDLGVVEHLSDRVVIMYLGRVVEEADTETVFRRPNHPYTRSLLDSVPRIENRKRAFSVVKGEIPSPLNPPPGLPLPSAVSSCDGTLPGGGAEAAGNRARPAQRLPFE
jgi:peptide/nickel transport system ATP-binding protein